EIFAQKPFDRYRARELAPGPDVKTDGQIDAFIRDKAESAYHPCGTAKMGPACDTDAVVDGNLSVHGIDALRVVDASVMPRITTGNLNAPVTMLAEKAADIIRGRPALPPSNAPVWIAPDWQSSQRRS